MPTTRELWIAAWAQLDIQIRTGRLTNRRTQGPTSATAKHLFPAVFRGDLGPEYYRPDVVTKALDSANISGRVLAEAVLSREPELLRLTSLVDRLRTLYGVHRSGRPRISTPLDFIIPIAREIFQTTDDPTDAELEQALFTSWPHESASWKSWPSNTRSFNQALSQPEVVDHLERLLAGFWRTRPKTAADPHQLSTSTQAVLARWRTERSAPDLEGSWTELIQTVVGKSLDRWAQAVDLTADPVPIPQVLGTRSHRLLDRPLRTRVESQLDSPTRTGLPPLGEFLEQECQRATRPAGLRQPTSAATLVLGYYATTRTADEPAIDPVLGSEQPMESTEEIGSGETLPAVLTAILGAENLLPRQTRSDGPKPSENANRADSLTASAFDRLAGHVDISAVLLHSWAGPQWRLWPRLLGRELRGPVLATIDDAVQLILDAFRSWTKDIVSGRLRGTPPWEASTGDSVINALKNLSDGDRAQLIAAIEQALPTNGSRPVVRHFRAHWERLSPPDSHAPNWCDALMMLRRHLRGTT